MWFVRSRPVRLARKLRSGYVSCKINPINCRYLSDTPDKRGYVPRDLLTSICNRILFSGPISVAQYMREVLTSPWAGYYIHADMLGEQGDFITSPEISQMFGELVAVWLISEWKALGSPRSFRLVELGPGRGTLSEDILRTFLHFERILKDVEISLDLVEISDALSKIQHSRLSAAEDIKLDEPGQPYKTGVTSSGVKINWYSSVHDVPDDKFTFFIAHEFFDALPVHKFIWTEKGWRELYVGVKNCARSELEMVVLPEATIASQSLIKKDEKRKHVEVSPESGLIVQTMAERIEANGGACLLIDYGHTGEKEDTLRGFKDHMLNDIFENVGEADITADVDFSYLLECVKESNVRKSGPITQQSFLKNMGIELRLMTLLENCQDYEQRTKLVESYKILMDKDHMGERFKVLALTTNMSRGTPVTAFYDEGS